MYLHSKLAKSLTLVNLVTIAKSLTLATLVYIVKLAKSLTLATLAKTLATLV